MAPLSSKRSLSALRVLVQSVVLLVLVWALWTASMGAVSWVNPSLFFKADPLAMFLTALAERILFAGVAVAAMVVLLTAIFGRFFCGWFCPLGTLIDLFDRLLSFIGFNRLFKAHRRENEPSSAKNIKYGVLVLLIGCAIVGVQVAWPMDPIAIVVRGFSFVIYPAIVTVFDAVFDVLLKATHYNTWVDVAYNTIRFNVF